MHPKTNDALTALVWDIMQWHIGQQRRLSRDMLIRRVNRIMKASDRQIRDAISELPIISTSGTGGYWLPADDAEIDEWAREMLSRTQQIYKRVAERFNLTRERVRQIAPKDGVKIWAERISKMSRMNESEE